jgi:glycosyltransferase 2 family protein
VAQSLRIPLSMSACFLMVPLNILIQTVPISFNGWGVRESVFILYFKQVGLPKESALAFSLVGAGLIVLLSLSGAVVWTSRGAGEEPSTT